MVPVGRPREFDEQEVLDRALVAFWTHGYEATSLVDLVEATGLKKGSLYQAFGDKHSLLLLALDHYLTRARQRMRACLDGPGELRSRLRGVLSSGCADQKRGCFAVNCLVELAPHDEEVQALLARHFRETEKLFARTIERGVEAGELTSALPPKELARLLQVVLTGAAASSKGHLTGAQANATIEVALSALF